MNSRNLINLNGTDKFEPSNTQPGPFMTGPVLINKNQVPIIISEFVMIHEYTPDLEEYHLEVIDGQARPQRLIFEYPLEHFQQTRSDNYYRFSQPYPLGILIPPAHFARICSSRRISGMPHSKIRYHVIGFFAD